MNKNGLRTAILAFALFFACVVPAFPQAVDESNYDDESGSYADVMRRRDRVRKSVDGVMDKGKKAEADRKNAGRDAAKRIASSIKPGKMLLRRIPSVWPISGWITSPFGMRRSPFTGQMRHHAGIDIGAPTGTKILAPAEGVVIWAGRDGGYGNSVEVFHGADMVTRYAHMSKTIAKIGDFVHKGDVLGEVGSTGRSTGPHLHYEVLLNGKQENPLRYISETPAPSLAEAR